MSSGEQLVGVCNIIDLCSAAEMIMACAAPLSRLEDDPAVRSLKGIVGGIEVQAQALLRSLEAVGGA